MGSSVASNEIPALQKVFHVPNGSQTILPATMYLIGFVLGPLVFAPLSEQYGRRPVLVWTLCLYIIFTMACALAPNWAALLVFRVLSGIFASPPMSVTGGSIADVDEDKVARGRANVIWSTATLVGPLAGPVISGYTYQYSWTWGFWAAMMLSGICLVAVLLQPETLATKILRDRAAKLNKEKGSDRYIAPADQERLSLLVTLKITTTRPIHLMFTEMLVSLTCLYMAFVYSVFYMLLEIFPDIFEGIYGFTAGESGLAFVIMFAGSVVTVAVSLLYDRYAQGIVRKHPHKQAEYLRLPIACIGGPLFVVALLWLGWTSKPSIPWIVPLLSMVPYGVAYQMIFMAMINYISDAYGIFASSALAACAAARSVAGAVIPLAVDSMVDGLGIAWSCSLLAFISCGLSLVPFGFIIWGEKIRARSNFSKKLQETSHPELELTRSLSLV
ncbi:MFS general substrate transporter [Cryphonectria parasitica EP155]|uniref:MFS general substrate transporter n=1 Tax=Cryphonectria parasitica (strain ATCC 38755 / EP155) TaxID=660469 RepID=A0A9P4Y2E7_CRYP1|nr:MFS general substrate transporter [Cryphonectria parasitica EP155]KAF3765376.1 MFS general substrate transporter [Cryphonectria parasitica EP155]